MPEHVEEQVEMILERTGDGVVLVEIVEIEIYGRRNERPPHARVYRVKIDGEPYDFTQRRVLGRDILERANKRPPERFQLDKKVHGGRFIPVGLAETVDLGEPGIEVFETFPLDEREG
jgi:hypothetical protein